MAALRLSSAIQGILALGLISSIFIGYVNGQEFDIASCGSLLPTGLGAASTSASPLILVPAGASYTPGSTITVFVASTSNPVVTDIILQARRVASDAPVGTFTAQPTNNIATVDCPNASPGATVVSTSTGTAIALALQLVWRAPDVGVGEVYFVASFVLDSGEYWSNVVSVRNLAGPTEIVPVAIGACPADTETGIGSPVSWTLPQCSGGVSPTPSCDPSSNSAFGATTVVTCTCADGLDVDSCQFTVTVAADPCAINPCLNQGVCIADGTNFICQCVTGFEGIICQTVVNPCNPNPCQNGGACIASGTNFVCVCVAGFLGGLCTDVDPCVPNPCLNGGVCSSPDGSCQCAVGFTGDFCADVVAVGLQCPGDIITADGTAVQYATPSCVGEFVIPNAVCTPQTASVFPSGVTTVLCQCFPFSGPRVTCTFAVTVTDVVVDPCLAGPCLNGGICTSNGGNFACACAVGFTGLTCANVIDPCQPNQCLNGGTCISLGGSAFFCQCVPQFSGTTCADAVVANPCENNPCANNGICTNVGGFASCLCTGGFVGPRCTDVAPEICVNNPCSGLNECRQSETALAGYTCHSARGSPCV